ncbi:MAG: DUF4432 family protein [Anaerolineae bacterium]|nr:DUF4432 family protein [Anaerolineae bacterium]
MTPFETQITLVPEQFSAQERTLATCGPLSATAFRFSSGVCALRLHNEHGTLTVLPFQGQQIWAAEFGGEDVPRRSITMRTPFEEPQPTREFLATFGGFLQHCGLSGTGGPGPEDTHPLHGELPNAPYQSATLVTGQDADGPYIGVGGAYRHTVTFGHDYVAEPLVTLRAGASRFRVGMTITNRKQSDMEMMYLMHVNFRPVDQARVVYSAPSTPQAARVRTEIPGHIRPIPGYREFLARMAQDPALHEVLAPELPFNPEVVLFLDYRTDEAGWAHSMLVHPDGSAEVIRHRPAELPFATRWISRTPDHDAIALVEPGTAEPLGYKAARERGQVKVLKPGERFSCEIEVGVLDAEQARQAEAHIRAILGGP